MYIWQGMCGVVISLTKMWTGWYGYKDWWSREEYCRPYDSSWSWWQV